MEKEIRFTCPVASKCGGCQMGKLSYREQLDAKKAWVDELLRPFCRVEPIIGMEDPFHYRNKTHAVLAGDRRGNVISGVYRAGTHDVVPVEHCLIENEKADEIIGTIRNLMKSFRIVPYNEDTRQGFLRHILIRTGHVSKQILVVLVAATPVFPSKNNFVKALLKAHPEITSIVLNINDRSTSMVLGKREMTLHGAGFIEDTLCGKVFRISPQSFYQINSVQTEKLYSKAIEYAALTGKETLLDAYCGIGTIGLIAAGGAKEVLGVEKNRDAVRDAIANAKRNKIRNAWFSPGDAGVAMEELAKEGEELDVVFMDPPRSGSDERFLHSLLTAKPERIVYISCGPDTLARDLEILTEGGYHVRRIQPVDMFPHTEHIETVVLLTK